MPDKINRRILFSRLMVGEPREGDFDLIEETNTGTRRGRAVVAKSLCQY